MSYDFPHFFSNLEDAHRMAYNVIRENQKQNRGKSEYKLVVMAYHDSEQPNYNFCIFDTTEFTSVSPFGKHRGRIFAMYFGEDHRVGRTFKYETIKKFL